MTQSDDDLFTQALREDLPEAGDETRVRARLVSAGVLAGAVVAPGAAVGAAAGAGGLSAKLVALPLALKLGASLALAGVVAVPVWSRVSDARRAQAGARSNVVLVPAVATPPLVGADAPAKLEAPSAALAETPAPEPLAGAREVARPAPARERETPRVPEVTPRPSVASFADAPAKPLDEGSLREETALMERALAALRRGDLAQARQALAQHASRFPNGHLVPERQRALERILGKETDHAAK